MLDIIKELAQGSLQSLLVLIYTLIFALPLGMLIAFGRMSSNRILSAIMRFYILIMRGTPLLLQLMFVAYGPYYIFHLNVTNLMAVYIAFILNYAAYFAEIYRGGIDSIPRGQYEAAQVLGFTNTQTFFQIILPQVIKRILPPMSNEVITLVKDTALASALGITELFRVARNETSAMATVLPLVIAGVFYLVMNWVVTIAFSRAEKKLSYYK